ncbi:MAG: hypothetical protein JWO21_1565 [Solirubrobacterales bacterium]|jgi:hypothetical protein|nr:hypothetical protein [Solirubrobacterales bacterium]
MPLRRGSGAGGREGICQNIRTMQGIFYAGELDGAADLLGRFRRHAWCPRRRLRARYRRVAEELYNAVARAAGATHVVDASHYPSRARELQALGGIETTLAQVPLALALSRLRPAASVSSPRDHDHQE